MKEIEFVQTDSTRKTLDKNYYYYIETDLGILYFYSERDFYVQDDPQPQGYEGVVLYGSYQLVDKTISELIKEYDAK